VNARPFCFISMRKSRLNANPRTDSGEIRLQVFEVAEEVKARQPAIDTEIIKLRAEVIVEPDIPGVHPICDELLERAVRGQMPLCERSVLFIHAASFQESERRSQAIPRVAHEREFEEGLILRRRINKLKVERAQVPHTMLKQGMSDRHTGTLR